METILKIREICKAYDKCYDGCLFHVDHECVLGIPPANWSDEDLYLIGKAVEQTTMNELVVDCIDRAELLKAVDTWDKFGCDANTKLVRYQDHYIPYIHYDDVIKCIKSMPSVTPQEPRWIPVSERLPEAEYGESDSVLVCFENETQDVLYFDGSNWRYPTGETYISVNHKNGWHNKVVAWIPLLPKPYREVEE